MKDLVEILFSEQLDNLDGLVISGEFRFPKHILVQALATDLGRKDEKQSSTKKDDDNDRTDEYQNIVKHIDLKTFNISFEDEMVCLKINVIKEDKEKNSII